jgi:hypothetical protein
MESNMVVFELVDRFLECFILHSMKHLLVPDVIHHVPVPILCVPNRIQWNFGAYDNGLWAFVIVPATGVHTTRVTFWCPAAGVYMYTIHLLLPMHKNETEGHKTVHQKESKLFFIFYEFCFGMIMSVNSVHNALLENL